MRSHKYLATVIAVALFIGVMFVSAPGFGEERALTAWQVFGSGEATGRGTFGWPSVMVSSTTLEDPAVIRYQILGEPAHTLNVMWSISCWNEGSLDARSRSGEYVATMPITRQVKGINVAAWDYCTLVVGALRDESDSGPGTLTVELQARYPAS